MNKKETVSYCLDNLKKAGADKAACSLNMTEKKELNVEINLFNLNDVVGGAWIPKDGKADPTNVAMALARQSNCGIVTAKSIWGKELEKLLKIFVIKLPRLFLVLTLQIRC